MSITSHAVQQAITFVLVVMAIAASVLTSAADAAEVAAKSIFAKDNLVAWCIVPFDASRRTPAERAEMLQRLGLTKVAYDWRDEHVPSFEEEITQYKKHDIEFFAFWSWHEELRPLIHKYRIRPQIWITAPSPEEKDPEQQVEAAATSLAALVDTTRELGLKLGLYNHGGWGGEPANLVAVCKRLRTAGAEHVGIVYNFHHGHAHIDDFKASLALMKPYLLCVNLNGMNDGENPKILSIGSGKHEQAMMEALRDSGYTGQVGVIHHREQLDAEAGLRQNLDGLQNVLRSMGDDSALRSFRR